MRKAIAIDFDGCLCSNVYPEIGAPNWGVIERAKREQRAGAGLILWTCREGKLLDEAVNACAMWGLAFDAVNESLPDWIEAFGNRPRKVGASEYWDDRAVCLPDVLSNDPLSLDELRELDGEPVWCVDGAGNQCWRLVNHDSDGLPICYDNEAGYWDGCLYGVIGDGQFGLHEMVGRLIVSNRKKV